MLSKVNPIQSKCGTRIDTSEEIIENELEQNVKSVQSAKSQLNQNVKKVQSAKMSNQPRKGKLGGGWCTAKASTPRISKI